MAVGGLETAKAFRKRRESAKCTVGRLKARSAGADTGASETAVGSAPAALEPTYT
jgi:hypothetical protein